MAGLLATCPLTVVWQSQKLTMLIILKDFQGLPFRKTQTDLALGGPKLVERWNHPDLDYSSYMLSLSEQWLARSE